jgi:hypothetical protein
MIKIKIMIANLESWITNMKYFLLTLLLSFTVQAKTIVENGNKYQCTLERTCEEELKKVKVENTKLRKQLAAKKEVVREKIVKQVVEYPYPVEKIVEKTVTKTKIKKHIISVMAVDGVQKLEAEKTSSNTAKASVQTGLIPALDYQYQFDAGLVLRGGATFGNEVKALGGIGYEF